MTPLSGYSLITLFVDQIPIWGAKRSSHMVHMDQIELFTPCLFLHYIVNLQNTVWRYPGGRRWEEVWRLERWLLYAVSAVTLRNEEEYFTCWSGECQQYP